MPSKPVPADIDDHPLADTIRKLVAADDALKNCEKAQNASWNRDQWRQAVRGYLGVYSSAIGCSPEELRKHFSTN